MCAASLSGGPEPPDRPTVSPSLAVGVTNTLFLPFGGGTTSPEEQFHQMRGSVLTTTAAFVPGGWSEGARWMCLLRGPHYAYTKRGHGRPDPLAAEHGPRHARQREVPHPSVAPPMRRRSPAQTGHTSRVCRAMYRSLRHALRYPSRCPSHHKKLKGNVTFKSLLEFVPVLENDSQK